jgi:hypothetical protein
MADMILGPVIISALLFIAILANFLIRGTRRFLNSKIIHLASITSPRAVSDDFSLLDCTHVLFSQEKNIPIPGQGLYYHLVGAQTLLT